MKQSAHLPSLPFELEVSAGAFKIAGRRFDREMAEKSAQEKGESSGGAEDKRVIAELLC